MKAAVRFDELVLARAGRVVVQGLSGTLAQGSLTAVVGPNGAGKSTLLEAIAGRLAPLRGRLEVAAPQLAYLPQRSALDTRFPMRVGDAVMLGAWRSLGAWRAADARVHAAAADALDAVGLAGFERRAVGELSGGQLQRVLFARLLMQDAPLILLDEPFTAIDARTVQDLLGLLHRWHAEGRTVVAVLHDPALVHEHFPDTLLLAREPLAWGPTPLALAPERWQQAHARADAW